MTPQANLWDRTPIALPAEGPACNRCLHLYDDDPSRPVGVCEELERVDGRKYFAGLCADCWDREWSERHRRRVAKAVDKGDLDGIERLAREKVQRIARGRRFYE